MKRMSLLLVAASVAATLSAAPEKVASLRIGGTEKIVAAVGKIGQFTGNETLGAMCSGAIMQSEPIQYFGPTRAGANVYIQIYADASKTNDSVSASVLYPVVAKKAKFLKHHKGAVEQKGVIAMPADAEGDPSYVVFSEDGKWASLADTPALAKAALADVAEAERPLGDALVRVDVASRAMDGICELAEATRAKGRPVQDRIDRATLDVLKAIGYLSVAIKVTDLGIDFDGTVSVKPGTELAKVGKTPFDKKALDALGKDVFYTLAIGADSALPGQKSWKDFVTFLRKHGFKLDFLKREEKPGSVRFTLDPVALVKYVTGPATNAFENLDLEKFTKDLENFVQVKDESPYAAKNPACVGAFAIKGCQDAFTPAERMKATLPELAGKKVFYASSGSFYAITRALLPCCLKAADEETQAALTPMLALLAPAAAPGVGVGMWREGDVLRGISRISAAEIKGFASCFALASAYSAASAGQDDDDDDADDASDGDDD